MFFPKYLTKVKSKGEQLAPTDCNASLIAR